MSRAVFSSMRRVMRTFFANPPASTKRFGHFSLVMRKRQAEIEPDDSRWFELGENVMAAERNDGALRAGFQVGTDPGRHLQELRKSQSRTPARMDG